ncbi:MAG: PAS domain S-box protein [Candidatus Omnitrophota bacterium]
MTDQIRSSNGLLRLASFPELNPNPVVEIGLDGTLCYSNPAAQKRFPDLCDLKFKHAFLSGIKQELQAGVKDGRFSFNRQVNIGGIWYAQNIFFVEETKNIRIYAYDITVNKQAEERLKESEEKYRTLMDDAGDAILLANIEGYLVEANKKAEKLLGYKKSDLLGMHFTMLHPQEEIRRAVPAFQKIYRNGSGNLLNSLFKQKDGKLVPADITGSVISYRGKKIMQVVIRDISDRKRAEEAREKAREDLEIRVQKRTSELANANVMLQEEVTQRKKAEEMLRQSEERYHRIISTITDYIYTVRMEKDGSVATIHSPSCVAVTGYTVEEFQYDPFLWLNMVHKDDKELVFQWSKHILDGHGVDPLEHRIKRKDGQIRWIRNTAVFHFDDNGKLASYDGVVQDITDAKIAEDERAHANALKTIIENSPDVLLVTDIYGRIIQFNKVLVENLGFNEEIIGQPLADLIAEPDRKKIAQGIKKCLNEGRVGGIEVKCLTGNRGEFFALVNISLLQDAGGFPAGLIAVITDITERKKMEEAKDESINIISHELRSPLAAVKEGVLIILDGLVGDVGALQQDVLVTVKNNVDRLVYFVNSILDYQRLNYPKIALDITEADINNAAIEAKNGMSILARSKNIEFLMELDKGLPPVKFDYSMIIQVLTNLLNNAVKFTDKGCIKIKTGRRGDTIGVCVEDTGIGIKQEEISGLFNIFCQASNGKKARSGSGLGLAICKKIIEHHGGEIWVESEYGKGSKFYFTLPA